MARRAVDGNFYSDTVNQLVFTDDPDEVVVVVDTQGPIGPVSNKQIVRISVEPHHDSSQDVAERIWQLLDWDDLEGEESVAPEDVDVRAKGWGCRVKWFY